MTRPFTCLILLLLIVAPFISGRTTDNKHTSPRKTQTSDNDNSWINKLGRKLGYFGPEFQCYACTMFITVVEQYVELHSLNIDDFLMNHLCKLFPIEVSGTCQILVNKYGPDIIQALIESSSPDHACLAIKICVNPACKLMPEDQLPKIHMSPNWPIYMDRSAAFDDIILFNWFEDLMDKVSGHLPAFDVDQDDFCADEGGLRGFNWRGRDCNDFDSNIHPGRKTDPYPRLAVDYNCNGISGKNPATGNNYKDDLCNNSTSLGVAVIGDSAGAHAEIPVAWVTASLWNATVFDSLVSVILDEVDLPQFSAYTGYGDVGFTGPSRSVYKYLYERNKCNFKDYQNIAVNGADSFETQDFLMALSRNNDTDHPLLGFLELLGNDVCWHNQTFSVYTTPAEFRDNIFRILQELDTRFPPGSHLVILGLVNGSLIYEGVKNKTHPIGVTYPQYYDYQNCLGSSFCWGWLNTNETVRDITTQKAMELNAVYKEVLTNYTAKNFDFIFYDFPGQEIWNEWIAAGNDPYLLIEPVDGFHPNQMFNALLADKIWSFLLRDRPEWLGDENPNNDLITQVFGNQGGY